MQTKRYGFTLTEMLVVVGIIAVLASIGYYAAAPSREMARQTVCINQLKQFFSVASLYSADTDAPYPELNGLSYMPTRGYSMEKLYATYGFHSSMNHCPSASQAMRKNLGSSYAWIISTNPTTPSGDISEARQRIIDLAAKMGDKMPIVECHIHDELFYAVGEREFDVSYASPFRIHLRTTGQVWRGRVNPPRTFIFRELSY